MTAVRIKKKVAMLEAEHMPCFGVSLCGPCTYKLLLTAEAMASDPPPRSEKRSKLFGSRITHVLLCEDCIREAAAVAKVQGPQIAALLTRMLTLTPTRRRASK